MPRTPAAAKRRPPPVKRAARAPGKKDGRGGRRAGAGRKALVIPPEVLARIGPPPYQSPLKMARWWIHVVAEATWLYVQGLLPAQTLNMIRAVAASSAKILPEDIRAESDRLLRQEEDEKNADRDSPDLEDLDDVADAGARSLRSDPS